MVHVIVVVVVVVGSNSISCSISWFFQLDQPHAQIDEQVAVQHGALAADEPRPEAEGVRLLPKDKWNKGANHLLTQLHAQVGPNEGA